MNAPVVKPQITAIENISTKEPGNNKTLSHITWHVQLPRNYGEADLEFRTELNLLIPCSFTQFDAAAVFAPFRGNMRELHGAGCCRAYDCTTVCIGTSSSVTAAGGRQELSNGKIYDMNFECYATAA